MSVGVTTCSPEMPVLDLARLMLDKNLEAVVVLDPSDGNALGVVTQEELVKFYSQHVSKDVMLPVDNDSSIPEKAADIMKEGVPQVPPDIPLTAAAEIMRDQKVRVLFLMHHAGGVEYPAAMLSYTHLLRHLVAQADEDLRDLGIGASRQSPIEAFIKRRDEAREKIRKSKSA
ncbi:MAG: cyclic nucleotide-binding/CBS domain-containing protein [Omnitrophica WOR_2 bacterium]